VASEAGVSQVNVLALGGVALRGLLGRRDGERIRAQGDHGERGRGETLGPAHRQDSSTRIGDHVDDSRLAALDYGDSARERGSKVVRISDRCLAMDAHAARDGGVVGIRLLERGAGIHPVDAAAVPRRHGREVHVFLMVSSVVVHDIENRHLMVRRCPQRAGIEHEVAIAAEGNREPCFLLASAAPSEAGRL